MNYLHYEFSAGPNDVILVTLDQQANVKLLDSSNYSAYHAGRSHTYYGGLIKVSPYRISPPHLGNWHVVIDLGGYTGTVRASAQIIKG
jgi:hypothetical protein